ncbi:AF-9 isoform X1, partial [Brachionus plicatilis]
MAEALQFVIEIGHKASTLKEPIGDFIYKWNLFLRSGDERQQIDKVVQKVVFNLHETFKNPTRECTQPPYCVKENGYGEFEFPIDIFFNGTGEKYTINYFLDLPPAQSQTPLYRFRKEVITFVEPNPEFRKLLIESGATVKKILPNCSATTSLKKKANSSSILNSSLNSPNTSVNSPNSSLVNLNSSKLNQAINGTSFLATHSAFPSEKKKSSSKK